MTKISQLSSIGDSLAIGDQFLIRDIDDTGSPNKSVTVSGITRALDLGTAAAPAIAFATDKNTGIFSPGADQVAISTNGTNRLHITSAGNVGIGTSAPSAPTHILAGGGSTNSINVGLIVDYEATAAEQVGAGTAILFRGKSGGGNIANYDQAQIATHNVGGNNRHGLSFYYRNAANVGLQEGFRLTGSGLVGIGTTTPGAPLHVKAGATEGIRVESPDFAGIYGFVSSRGTLGSPLSLNSVHSVGALDPVITFNRSTNGTTFAESARIDSSGRLLVGTSSVTGIPATLNVIGGNNTVLHSQGANADSPFLFLSHARGTAAQTVNAQDGVGAVAFVGYDGTNALTSARIEAFVDGTPGANDMPGRLVFSTTADGAASPTERMRITSGGLVGIGVAPQQLLHVRKSEATASILLQRLSANWPGNIETSRFIFSNAVDTAGSAAQAEISSGLSNSSNSFAGYLEFKTASTSAMVSRMTINSSGAVNIVGSLSKGSGSFKINHPLSEKTTTHHLVHSFIEGPQADLIYRGHVNLTNGKATINIDEAARMTEGTFKALCTNVCCFTSNESDWTAVRGSVFDNILTIEAQDLTSTAKVCWMVIGERKDQHMLDTDWTDENGRVITEPMKEVTPSVTP